MLFVYYRTGLVKDTLIAIARMVLQLLLVGLYLEFIFELNSPFVNLLWLLIMVVAATQIMISRSGLNYKYFVRPVIAAVLTNVIINGSVFAFFIVGKENIFDARYLIPMMGMVIGNTVTSSIIGIRTFFNLVSKDLEIYKYKLMLTGSKSKALFEFNKAAMQEAFNPVIASTATIGLIWLPGMMTGQILGGSDPMTAIKYQILIVIAIFAGSVINGVLAINLSKSMVFDDLDMFLKNALKKK
jgi:putative ABC transport system permease protein